MSKHCKSIISAKPLHFSQKVSPAELFSTISDQPWAMWLDSCVSEHIDSQYDIIVWDPTASVVAEDERVLITHYPQSNTVIKNNCPIEALNATQQEIFNQYVVKDCHLPFKGGSLGYFSYDLGRQFEQLPSQATKDIPMPEMAVGLYTHAIIFNNKTHEYSLVCPEDKRHDIEKEIRSLRNISLENVDNFRLTSSWEANISKKDYQEKFDRIQQYLVDGDCYQINLTQRFSSTYQGDEFDAYMKLRAENRAPFSAFIRLEKFAILSISPERFVQVQGKDVQTKPIKGTIARSSNSTIDTQRIELLKSSAKDRAENLMIVDLLRNDISKVCQPGTVKVPKLFDVESFPSVHHLVSTVEGTLKKEKTSFDLLRAAFPGGSITGAPKIRAMEIIDELEPQRRSIYCGSIGYISSCGKMDTSITIRTLACHHGNIHCWAGGGIVADSQVDAEYQESFDKVNKILPVLENIS